MVDNVPKAENNAMSLNDKQLPTKQLLYNHLPPISQTIQVRQVRHARNCW